MSRVYFHMIDGTVEVYGSERAHAAWLAEAPGAALMLSFAFELQLELAYQRPGMLRMLWSDNRTFEYAGQTWNGWNLILNTAIDIGSDVLRFLTRMHAQCEIHGWFAGEDRAWLADLVQQAIDSKVVRADMPGPNGQRFATGWCDLVTALRRNNQNPVVMSYSVCNQFPRSELWHEPPQIEGDADGCQLDDKFEELAEADQWRVCMPTIAAMRITPTSLREQGFGDGRSALDFQLAVIAQNNA